MPKVLASDAVDQATILMPSFLRTKLCTAKVVAQANLEGAFAAEQPDVDGAAWFVEREGVCGCSVQSHGAWMAKSAMRHQPMRGHAPGAMLAECLSCPVGEIRDLLQGS